ncbi:GntR family transcriptional regulator [Leucobacter komagatae]|uniref:GntR family transcriptional regulator n=1 Tax=Leucobacter komagatae TaxID=55969 RepID=UPI0006969AC6|nr:GntR family transcriptional regulator [Leucobacter komagatae]
MTAHDDLSNAVTLGEQVYCSIQAAIADGTLTRGQRITERGLADLLGVSTTPVREAVRQLTQEGMIERLGPRKLHIANLSRTALNETDEIEAELQGLIAKFATRKATGADITKLSALIDDADNEFASLKQRLDEDGVVDESRAPHLFDALRDFHAQLVSIAENPILERLLNQTAALSPEQRATASQLRDPAAIKGIELRYPDHRLILDAIRSGDAERAYRAARDHALSAHGEIRRSA